MSPPTKQCEQTVNKILEKFGFISCGCSVAMTIGTTRPYFGGVGTMFIGHPGTVIGVSNREEWEECCRYVGTEEWLINSSPVQPYYYRVAFE